MRQENVNEKKNLREKEKPASALTGQIRPAVLPSVSMGIII